MKHSLLFLPFYFVFNLSLHADNENAQLKEQAGHWMNSHEVKFIENRGQMSDMDGKPVPYVLFKAEAPNVNLWITETGLTLQTLKGEEAGQSNPATVTVSNPAKEEETEIHWERVDLTLQCASIKRENIIKEKSTEGHFNFFYPHCPDGIYDVKEFEKITIKEVYPGIDWVFYNSTKKGFKYDFVVHPGADPQQIKLVYSSQKKLNITEDGELLIATSYGNLTEQAPESFLNGKPVASRFKKITETKNSKDGYNVTIGFDLKGEASEEGRVTSGTAASPVTRLSSSDTLVIDPQLFWATFYGGSNYDGPLSIATDSSGNVFVMGYNNYTSFPTQNAGTYYQGVYGGGSFDIFILKFDNKGVRVWATYYGGSSDEWGSSITTDPAGNVYVAGPTISTNFPVQNAGTFFQGTNAGAKDAFILKFDNAGNRLWATYYGGSNGDECSSVATDASGNVYLIGNTNSIDLPTQNAGTFFQGTNGGSDDIFILKFDNAGNRLWATYYGGASAEAGTFVTADVRLGLIYIVGYTGSVNFPTQNAGAFFQGANAGGDDAFILKFDDAGNRLWATYYGGSGNDHNGTVAADALGNIFISGSTTSTNLPTQNAGTFFQGTNAGGLDAYLLKFDNSGNRLWATYFGGNGNEYDYTNFDNLAIDRCGNVYLSFETASTNMTTLASCDGGYYDNSFNGGVHDQFISLFTNGGALVWATYFGGNGNDYRSPIALDTSGNLFLSGEWTTLNSSITNTLYPLTNPGSGAYYDSTFNGMDDAFMAKFTVTPCICNLQSIVPHAVFVSSDTVFCGESGECIDFTDHSTNNPTSWKWFFPGAVPDTSTQQNPANICYYNPGTYAVKLVVSNGNGSDSLTVSPMITFATAAAPPVLTFSGDTIFCSHAAAYQWYLDGSPIAGATDSFYVATINGVYAVQITDDNGCTRLSNGFPEALNEVNGAGGIRIYPNPVKEELWVVGYELFVNGSARIEINTILGENVYRSKLSDEYNSGTTDNRQLKTMIDVSSWAKGVYVIQLITDKESYRARVIKE